MSMTPPALATVIVIVGCIMTAAPRLYLTGQAVKAPTP